MISSPPPADPATPPPPATCGPGITPLIEARDVSKSFEGKTVLRRVSLSVREGEVLAIIGQSGCGKSTLLKILAGLEQPDQGEVVLNDERLTLIFQYSALFDSMTVFENVAFPLLNPPDERMRGYRPPPIKDIARQVSEKLTLLGLSGIEERFPSELSGGMRIILYDEPTAGLDPIASKTLEDYIVRLSCELKAASVVVTHTMSTIFRTAHRVLLLHKGQAHWEGPPEALLHADDPFVKEFVDSGFAARPS